jgi:hypothetical protein
MIGKAASSAVALEFKRDILPEIATVVSFDCWPLLGGYLLLGFLAIVLKAP